jgi:hypothetical protein
MINSSKEFTNKINKDYKKEDEDILKLISNLLLQIKYFKDSSISEKIKKLIDDIDKSINKDITNYKIESIFAEYFSDYLYEKIGHIISNTDEYMLLHNNQKFKIGDIVLYEINNNIYSISIIKNINQYNNNIEIMTNNKNYDIDNYNQSKIVLEEQTVLGGDIIKFHYNSTKEVIETYNINYRN